MNRWIALSILFLAAGAIWQLGSASAQTEPTSGQLPATGLASEKNAGLDGNRPSSQPTGKEAADDDGGGNDKVEDAAAGGKSLRPQLLVGSLAVFMLAVLVGFEIIAKVPPTLHTPLMSGSNAISGITIVGALLVAGAGKGYVAPILGFIAIILAAINVVGGFLVTHRMLAMFNKR
jgi:H+-translocating NAD(P) transhydrogenase subunit alpha